MKFLALLTIISTCIACNSEDSLNPICGNFGRNKCYGVWNDNYKDPQLRSSDHAEYVRYKAEKGLVGPCKFGVATCDEDYNIVGCEGAVYPHDEKCDGVDNNCDGEVDNGYYYPNATAWYYEVNNNNPCPSTKGVCADAKIRCEDGEFICDLPNTYEEDETTCDNLDNDCNARVDDIDLTCTDLLGNEVRCVCYEGPGGTDGVGQCTYGAYECLSGEVQCTGQILPSAEVCDGFDNDCNGISDDVPSDSVTKFDIVFILDNSASMCDEIDSVIGALDSYVGQFFDSEAYKFAIVVMNDFPSVRRNFSSISDIKGSLATLTCQGNYAEASLDSMEVVCNSYNPLNLNWRQDSKHVFFMFTDENPQSYTTPQVTPEDVVNSCIETSTTPFIWSSGDIGFTYITSNANGRHFDLIASWETILDNLNDIIVSEISCEG